MASEAIAVPHPDISDEQIEKKVIEEVKPDDIKEKIVPPADKEVETPAEPVPPTSEEKPLKAPAPVVEEEKPVVAPLVKEAVKIVETPFVEALENFEEEKPEGIPSVEEVAKFEDAAESVVEERLEVVPPVEEVTRTPELVEDEKQVAVIAVDVHVPEPVIEPVAAPSVEEAVKPEEEVTPVEQEKPVAAPAVEEVISTTELAEIVDDEKPVAAPAVEEVTKTTESAEIVEDKKPVADPVDEEVIKTEDVSVPVEEEKTFTPPAVEEFTKIEDNAALVEEEKPVVVVTRTIEEAIPVAAPLVEEVAKTDVPVEEDKQVPAPHVEETAEPIIQETLPAVALIAEVVAEADATVVEEKLAVAPEAVVIPDVLKPAVSEPAERLVETPVKVVEKCERSLDFSVEQPDEAVPAAVVEPEVPLVEENIVDPVAVVDEKKEETEPPTTLVTETIKEAVSPADVIEPVKAEEAVPSELAQVEDVISSITSTDVEPITETKLDETPSPVETSTGRTLAEKLNEEKTTGSEQVQESLKSKLETRDKEPTTAEKVEEKVEETTKSAEPIVVASKPEEDTKTDGTLPAEVETKTAPKQSNNLLSKVKKSLVKAKKAILRKSPSSKNPPVTNEDLKVK